MERKDKMKRMKKTLAGILAAALVAGSFPILSGGQLDGFIVQAGAEDTRPSGIKGNVTATVDNGVLRVQKVPGTDGRMSEDYTGWAPNGKNSLTEAARASVTRIVIEPGVVNIAKEAFQLFPNVEIVGYTGLNTDITLSSIGGYAFAGLSHLKTVTLPNSVSSLSSHAFEGCSSLRSINIPKNLSSIGDHAFSRCYGLSQLYIPNNVTRIGEYAFSDCSNLSTVTFENPYTKGSPLWIGDYAFYGVNDATIAYTGVYELYDGESDIDAGTPVYTLSGKSLKWSPVHYTITTEATGIGDVIVSDTHPAIGEKVDLTITPYGTYKTKVISVTDASGNYVNLNTVSDTSYYFRMPASDVTISVEFQRVYDIDVYATKYGTVKVADYTLAEGETARVTFVPDEGAYLDEYSVVSSGTRETIAEGKGSSVTFKMPAYDVEIYAWFKKKKYDITINSANNGTVTANTSSAAEGSNVSLTVTPDEGYILSALYVRDEDGGLLSDALDYTFVMPDSDVTVTPVFEVKPVEYIDLTNAAVYVDTGSKTVTVYVDNDDVPVGAYNVQYFPEGSDTPAGTDFPTEAGTYIAAVSAAEGSGYTGAARSEPFTVTKSADKTPRTTPSYVPDVVPEWSPVHYTITTEATGIGDVIVSDTHPAIGEKVDLTITPYGTYKTKVISVTDASGNYVNLNTVSDTSYYFRMPASDVTISVEFQRVYDIDVYATKYGTVKVADYTLAEGETARVTFVPDEGAYLDEYSVVSSGTRETIAEGKGSSVTFKMPAYDVEIYAWFKKKKYDITINSANNGTVTANTSSAAEGSNVSLTVTPDEGYILSALYVRDEDGGLLSDALDYTFVMPDSDVTVTPVFEVKPVEYIDLTNAAVYVDTGSKTVTVYVDNDDVPVGAYNVQYFPEGSDTPAGTDFPTEAGTYIAAVSAAEGSGYTGAARSEPFTVTKSADKTPRTTPSYIPDVVPEKETTPDTTPDITPSYIPNYIPAYIPTTTTTTVTTPAVDISKYSIKAQEDSDSFRLSWEAVPNAESYALYIQKDGNYLLVAELGKDTSAEIIEATNKTDFYVSTGGDYTKYKYDAKKGFTKAGTLAADKINTVKRANNVEEAFMVKYKISGVYSADRDSYKVSAKVYYKPAIKAVVSKDRARLSFAAVKDAEGYGLFRLNANGKLKLISETTKNAFIVNGLKYGKKYTYAVKALVNGSWTKVYKSDLVTVKAK